MSDVSAISFKCIFREVFSGDWDFFFFSFLTFLLIQNKTYFGEENPLFLEEAKLRLRFTSCTFQPAGGFSHLSVSLSDACINYIVDLVVHLQVFLKDLFEITGRIVKIALNATELWSNVIFPLPVEM